MIKSRGEQPLGRNPFDLTNRHVYTQKVAKIMPVKALHTMPDDYFDVEMSEFSQNNIPMNTAAFLSGKKELLAYFVPYNSIWHNYNQYQATREDPESSALKVKGISYEPRMSLNRMYVSALYFAIGAWMYEDFSRVFAPYLYYTHIVHANNGAWTKLVNEYGVSPGDVSLPNLIKFMKDNHYAVSTMSDWEFYCRKCAKIVAKMNFSQIVSGFPLGITFDCYEHYVAHDSNLTYGQTFMNMFSTPIWTDWIMKMDMLRYGNIYPIIRNWRNIMSKHVDGILNDSTNFCNTTGFYHDTYDFETFYLDSVYGNSFESAWGTVTADTLLKLDAYTKINDSGDYSEDEYVNVYALYSYNKCFYDYMRNVYYDTDYNVFNYNVDFVDCTDFETSIIYPSHIPCRFYHLECHQWKKDLFTGVLPSNQLGAVSQVSVNVVSNGWMTNDNPTAMGTGEAQYSGEALSTINGADISKAVDFNDPSNGLFAVGGSQDPHGVLVGDSLSIRTPHSHLPRNYYIEGLHGGGSFDVITLKRVEALQQYAQDLMRAGNRTQDIFNQIYGVTPKSQLDESPYFIDVASNDLNINPIVATASTGQENNGRLGDIAARAIVSGKSLNFKFSTKDFGIVLFLSYIVPDSMYNSYNLDPCVCHLDPESHGLPYFQNLGLQPVIGEYLNNLKPISVRSRVCGYAPPYIERKTDIDLVHGNLVDTFLPKVGEDDLDSEYNGELSHWVVARTDMQQEDTVSLRNFYIDPRIVDNVFQFEADSDLSTDHFLTYSVIKVNSVRALSELGLPRF